MQMKKVSLKASLRTSAVTVGLLHTSSSSSPQEDSSTYSVDGTSDGSSA